MPKVIDLFAGAGGLSLGASRAGFSVAGAIENDPFAFETHAKNFPSSKHSNDDISKLTGNNILSKFDLQQGEVDGIIGGPPCQGFSRIGQRDSNDQRNTLFSHFFNLIDEIQPKFFLVENVPGIMDKEFDELRTNALNQVSDDYILLDPMPVSAHHYGAPTTRTRVFFLGYKPSFFDTITRESFLTQLQTEKVYVRKALQGLPKKISGEWQKEEDGWRRVKPLSESIFASKVTGEIPDGVGHRNSVERYLTERKVSGCLGTRHSLPVLDRYSKVGAGETDKVSRAVRLNPKGFCPTLRAGTGKDKGSHQAVRPLHPYENRVITPREAARLQGFPDWFVFHKTKWHSFRQIGNSVSPIAAEKLLSVIYEAHR